MKLRLFAVLLAIHLIVLSSGVAQTATQSNNSSVQSNDGAVVLPDGTSLVLRAKQRLSSDTSRKGDVVEFEVVKPAMDGALVIVAKGATATAHIANAEPAKRKGRGGYLEVAFDAVQLVTGEKAPIRAAAAQSGGGQREMVGNMVAGGLATAGLAAPLFLLQKGDDVEIRVGERYVAQLNGELKLARADVAAHQPGPAPKQRPDVAAIYIIKAPIKGELTTAGGSEVPWPMMIGEQGYHLSPNSALRIELPPGKYWLHATYKPQNKLKPDEIVSVDAKGGESYYYQFALGRKMFVLESVPEKQANDLLTEVEVYVNLPIEQATPEQLKRVKVPPKGR